MKSLQRSRWTYFVATTAALFAIAFPASAHEAGGNAHALHHGVLHPVTGLDHLLAMVAIGLWAAQLGGKARWLLPTAFVATTALGAILGATGLGLIGGEFLIALSVGALGLALLLARPWPTYGAAAVAAFFGLAHGHAHGLEMPQAAGAIAYGSGFIISTALLHGAGLLIGTLLLKTSRPLWLRLSGGGILMGFGAILLGLT